MRGPFGVIAGARRRATGFTPPANLMLWLDATDASTLTLDGSGNVSQWDDKSGRGNHHTPVAANVPLTTINGLDALNINNVSDRRMRRTSTAGTGGEDFTFFVVAELTTTGNLGTILHHGSGNSAGTARKVGVTSGNNTFIFGTDTNTSPAWSSGVPRYVAWVFDSTAAIRVNGAASYTTSGASRINTIDNIGSYVGGRNSTTHETFRGKIGEVLQFDRALTGTEISDVESYLAAKWNI